MDMLSYLTALIKTHKEVGIPGFGTIYKKKSPGRYDAETHSFLPPSYVIDFSPEVREEQLLIAYICKKKNISAESAIYYIDQFVDDLKQQLETNQEASLKPIGTVSHISGNWAFYPEENQNFGFDFYGLPTLKEENITTQDTTEVTSNPDSVTSVVNENHIEEENPGDGSDVHPLNEEHQITEEQLDLENSNADLTAGDPVNEETAIVSNTPVTDDQPVYEEIEEVKPPARSIPQPSIETPEGLEEETDEQTSARPTINEMYAQTVKAAAPPARESSEFYNSQNEDPERAGVPLYLKIFIALLIIMIALAATYFIKPDLFDPILKRMQPPVPVSEQQKEQALKQTTDSLAYADSIKNSLPAASPAIDSAKKDSLIKTPEATKPAATTPPGVTKTETAAIPAGTTYEVIGSSVIGQNEAERFIAQMKVRGIIAKAIPPEKGKRKIKISIATFKDEASARAERPKLQEKLGIEGLYIYTNKPQ